MLLHMLCYLGTQYEKKPEQRPSYHLSSWHLLCTYLSFYAWISLFIVSKSRHIISLTWVPLVLLFYQGDKKENADYKQARKKEKMGK